MTLEFPANPALNQQWLDPSNGTTYMWDGQGWTIGAVSPGTVTTVKGTAPIVSDESPTEPVISITQSGINLASCNNNAGFITIADLPSSSVVSVNGETGNVVLTAADVGALSAAGGTVDGDLTVTGFIDVTSYVRTANNFWSGNKYDNGTGASMLQYGEFQARNDAQTAGDFVWRAYSGGNGNGQITSSITSLGFATFAGTITLNNFADLASAPTGSIGVIASIGGTLCYHDGTSYKTVTLGAAPA